uniref:Forkhead box protein N3 n=1 Tax=Denticeps clupeoides TaxID=299321 RepID=A0AAY4D828_9TELE
MGPIMPPGKKAEGPSSGSVARGLSQLYQDAETAGLSLSLSASLSRAEDEELTSLSWLHESTDLLTSLGHPVLRSVSPVQEAGGCDPTHSSPSSSPDQAEPAYDSPVGPNRKPPYSFSCLIFMAIEDAPSKRLPVKDIYGWILDHFPYFASAPTGWKNSVRHNLSLNKCFKKVDKDRSQSIGKGSLWSIDPEYRHNLIQALKKTPYHPYSPRLSTAPTSAPTSLQAYHSPPLWHGSPLFRKNGVLLQVPQRAVQNGGRVSTQELFPVIRPLPISPIGNCTTAMRSFLTHGRSGLLSDSPPASDDMQEDHTYSSAKSPSMQQGTSSCAPQDGDGRESPVEVNWSVKQEPQDIPLSIQPPRRRVLWTKGRGTHLPGDTLPLKKRRAEKPPESDDDEEMKEAAGSLLHLAGVRACLNNSTKHTAKDQKEPKEAVRN